MLVCLLVTNNFSRFLLGIAAHFDREWSKSVEHESVEVLFV